MQVWRSTACTTETEGLEPSRDSAPTWIPTRPLHQLGYVSSRHKKSPSRINREGSLGVSSGVRPQEDSLPTHEDVAASELDEQELLARRAMRIAVIGVFMVLSSRKFMSKMVAHKWGNLSLKISISGMLSRH